MALAAGVLTTGVWGYVLLDRTPGWHPALRLAVLAAAAIAAALLLAWPLVSRRRPLLAALAVAGAVAMLGAPGAYALQTASTAHTGSIPIAGPAAAGSGSGGGGGFGGSGGPRGGTNGRFAPPSGTQPTGAPPSGTGARPGGLQPGSSSTTASSALVKLLQADTTHRWVAATTGSQSAAPLELSTGRSVIAIGGFSGSDPAPTLAQFKEMVAKGEIHYYIAGGGGGGGNGPGRGSGGTSEIASWVSTHFTSLTVGGQTIYDLTRAAS
jgi:hypothetical protein